MAGEPTAYQEAVADALRRSGASPTDPVMLVGHSQGGMVAARSADGFVRSGQFNVTHVVTAGSPVGRTPVHDSVQVLSLENRYDLVPRADAADNPDALNRTTVRFEGSRASLSAAHDMRQSYVLGAGWLDVSEDASVRSFRESAGAFLGGGTQVRVDVYAVSRDER